jgi:hypothetical protein
MKKIPFIVLSGLVVAMSVSLVSCAVKPRAAGERGDPPMPPLVSPPAPLPF